MDRLGFFPKLIANSFFIYLDLIKFSNNDMSINTMITILIVVGCFQKPEQKLNRLSISKHNTPLFGIFLKKLNYQGHLFIGSRIFNLSMDFLVKSGKNPLIKNLIAQNKYHRKF